MQVALNRSVVLAYREFVHTSSKLPDNFGADKDERHGNNLLHCSECQSLCLSHNKMTPYFLKQILLVHMSVHAYLEKTILWPPLVYEFDQVSDRRAKRFVASMMFPTICGLK